MAENKFELETLTSSKTHQLKAQDSQLKNSPSQRLSYICSGTSIPNKAQALFTTAAVL